MCVASLHSRTTTLRSEIWATSGYRISFRLFESLNVVEAFAPLRRRHSCPTRLNWTEVRRDDNGSAGHGPNGSTNLSGSRGSRVSTRDPLTHDQVNKIARTGKRTSNELIIRHCRDLRHSLSHNVSLFQLFLWSILWQLRSMQGFTPRPVNQAGTQGEEAGIVGSFGALP